MTDMSTMVHPPVYVFWNLINPCNEMPCMIGCEGVLLANGGVKIPSHQSTVRPEHIIFITSVDRGAAIHAALKNESVIFNEKVKELKSKHMGMLLAQFPELKAIVK